jgi:D-aminopeptidase
MRFGSAYVIGLAAALSCFPIFASGADVATVSTRARELGVPFDGAPGELNAITDVLGVEVGHTTLLEGEGKLIVGKGPVRTGVTAIFPLGKNNSNTPVPAAVYAFNGNGEMTGSALGGGIRLPRGTGDAYQHTQRGRSARRGC